MAFVLGRYFFLLLCCFFRLLNLIFLGCGSKLWTNREFSFTKTQNGNEIYMRYKSFDDQNMFQKALNDYVPHKIDIGGVFNKKVKKRKIKLFFSEL